MRVLALACCLVSLAGCDSDPVLDAPRAELLTDQRTYHRDLGPTIRVSLANVSDETLYIAAPSFDTVLDKREGGEWVEVGAWYGIAGIGPFSTPLEPGTSRSWPDLTPSAPERPLDDGEYRIRTRVYQDAALDRLLPEGERVSKPFEIVSD